MSEMTRARAGVPLLFLEVAEEDILDVGLGMWVVRGVGMMGV
jgi:hypothetical protein